MQNFAIRPIIANPSKRFKRCWPLKTKGLPETKPCNFPKAMMEPVNVTAPLAVPIAISTQRPRGMLPSVPILKALGL